MALVKCKFCGGDVADTAPKCPHCGKENPSIGAPVQNQAVYTQRKPVDIFSIIGIIVGAITIITGIFIQSSYMPYISDIKFGADFYTEMYAITADTLKAVYNLNNNLDRLCGTILIAFGSFEICLFGSKLLTKK